MKAMLLAGLLVTVATGAFAQDVVMRRPLPNTPRSSSIPASVTPTPTPSTPTPSTPTPGLGCEGNCPGDETISDPDDGGGVDAEDGLTYFTSWEVGPWEGDAACGVQSVLTRSVRCVGVAYRYNGNDRDEVHGYPTTFEDRVCEELSDYGPEPKPVTRYTGLNANCSYEIVPGDFGDWSGTCGDISRSAPAVCMASSGPVPMSRCMDNLREGGTRDDYSPDDFYEYDYTEAGCTFAWSGYNPTLGECVGGVRSVTYQYQYCAIYDKANNSEVYYLNRDVSDAECGPLPTFRCDGPEDPDDPVNPNLSCQTLSWGSNGNGNQHERCNSSVDGQNQVSLGQNSDVCTGDFECCREMYYEYSYTSTSDNKVHTIATTCSAGYHPGPRVSKEEVCPTDGTPSGYLIPGGGGAQYPYMNSACVIKGQ